MGHSFIEIDRLNTNSDDSQLSVSKKVSAVLRAERDILSLIVENIEGSGWRNFSKALNTLNNIKGRVIVSGMGKSGHIGKKIAATMSSLGTPAHFVHPGEASHGDLGMITERDALLALSNSGNTTELKDIILYSKKINIPIVAVTMGADSFLAQEATNLLLIPKMPEGCAIGLAPTTSTTAQLALGDALSVGLSVMRDFDRNEFHRFHPGGALGASTTMISEIMTKGKNIPLIRESSTSNDAIWEMANKSFNICGVINGENKLIGIVRASDISSDVNNPIQTIMRMPSHTASPKESVSTANSRMDTNALNALFVVENDQPIGIIRR